MTRILLLGLDHRAAASALSSGRVLKAIAAPGAALRTALMGGGWKPSSIVRLPAASGTPCALRLSDSPLTLAVTRL